RLAKAPSSARPCRRASRDSRPALAVCRRPSPAVGPAVHCEAGGAPSPRDGTDRIRRPLRRSSWQSPERVYRRPYHFRGREAGPGMVVSEFCVDAKIANACTDPALVLSLSMSTDRASFQALKNMLKEIDLLI